MQLLRIRIPSFRNLRDFDITFETHLATLTGEPDGLPKPIRSHALIGQNGTGKSNLMEAMISIFRDIDLDRDASFDYTLEYEIHGHIVKIEADISRQQRPFVWVDGDRVSQDYLIKNDPPNQENRDERRGPRLLPSHIFAYYSGQNKRIQSLFWDHQRRFNRRQEITAEEVLSENVLSDFSGSDADIRAVRSARSRRENQSDDRLRRLFYCRGGHSQLVLLACLLSEDPIFQQLLKDLHIKSLESALFVLNEPHRIREKRRRGDFDENDLTEGDPRFWFAKGNVVTEFLDKLWQVAWAPIQDEVVKNVDFRGRTERQRQLYLYVPSLEKLKQLGEMVGSTDSFFRYAEGAYIGDLIDEVRIIVEREDEETSKVSFTQLSEGELQMLTVLGLMRITADDNCLFLLDEPDTHLNPIWKLRYFQEIEKAFSPTEEESGLSQCLIATHDPLMIGSLHREQVTILRKEGTRTVVIRPENHPQGMGVTGLLKSEMFGLTSTLDPETQRRLQRRNDLLSRQVLHKSGKDGSLSRVELVELDRLSSELADLGFATSDFRDPDYALFVNALAKHRELRKPELNSDELVELEVVADQIVSDFLAQRGEVK